MEERLSSYVVSVQKALNQIEDPEYYYQTYMEFIGRRYEFHFVAIRHDDTSRIDKVLLTAEQGNVLDYIEAAWRLGKAQVTPELYRQWLREGISEPYEKISTSLPTTSD